LNIAARSREIRTLQRCLDSKRSEFIALYGRRRVGKSFLISQFFKENIVFYFTGTESESDEQQRKNFQRSMSDQGFDAAMPQEWGDAFQSIKKLIIDSSLEKKVIVIDEMPWLAESNNSFISALEFFWNGWAFRRDDVVLVVCGSASSWMLDNVINEHGGLYGRLTCQLEILPFTLYDCEEFFAFKGVHVTRFQIAQLYMIFGGIAYYLDYYVDGESVEAFVDRMLFAKGAPLRMEYDRLFHSMFRNPQAHFQIVDILTQFPSGLTRKEILAKTGLSSGGYLSKVFRELEQSGFIKIVPQFPQTTRDARYKICDFFILFFRKFLKDQPYVDERFWQNTLSRALQSSWYGIAFERLCFSHSLQIRQRLSIAGVKCTLSRWQSKNSDPGAQIDIVIDRDDRIIDLCETKFTQEPFYIGKSDAEGLRRKRSVFASETKTKKAIHIIFISATGYANNSYLGEIQHKLSLDDLFMPPLDQGFFG